MRGSAIRVLLAAALSLLLQKSEVTTLQLYGNEVTGTPDSLKGSPKSEKPTENVSSQSIPNIMLDGNTQFSESLKDFLKGTNSAEGANGKSKLFEGDAILGESFLEENKDFINKQVLSDLYSKFIIEVVNNSTVSFLDNLSASKSSNTEFQIELEESCSPFFCEKVMKAKEVDASAAKAAEASAISEVSDGSAANSANPASLLTDEKEIKLHSGGMDGKDDLVMNLDAVKSVAESTTPNGANQADVEGLFTRTVDGNEEKQKIILTDGDNVYVLEEITQGSSSPFSEEELNKQQIEQEIKMHIPSEVNERDNGKNRDLLEEVINSSDSILDDLSGPVNNIQTGSEKGIREHDLTRDPSNSPDSTESNQMNNIGEDIFTMNEEELSKKILDDIKMNSEDKVECYTLSNDEKKCNSYKKCTYVNIDNKDTCFLDYNYMLFLKNNNCSLQPKSALLSISKDLLKNEIINRQMFQLLRNSNNNNFICDTITYSFLTNVVDNTNYEEIFT
ncbi:hypothetical protein C922_04327 [Plasmodium inui San Antonio 1]|uniref:Uncharacterized protein n=1 Tax=Plasmodium inui San Antonio 1 TaxID=1237626 RepID=W7A1H2_9APIC|nr:hypothetical protein C922_04327 [Plasmodium inui San Antonio 1]EUD65198.1 hypothetical protein C922_04327 [Plasmodium inui San Antonio 1]